MVNIIFKQEEKMWESAKAGNSRAFLQTVSEDAVMVCGGYRCTGREYAEFIGGFGISDFEITGFETIYETDKTVQVHYIVKTSADSPENADLAGIFHVTSTWEKRENEWKLIFNMDSRIIER